MPGPVILLFESVEQVRFADITDAHAMADELRTALRTHYYPGIGDDDVVDFVRFRTGTDQS